MPVCPDCGFWTPEFAFGELDQYSTWYCNGCWDSWETQRREQRISSGRLLPEDRSLWYFEQLHPVKLYEYDKDINYKLQYHEAYSTDLPWLKVDSYSLVLECFLDESTVMLHGDDRQPSPYLANADEDPAVTQFGEASWFKSLNWKTCLDDEFILCLDGGDLVLTDGPPLPMFANFSITVGSLADLDDVLFPDALVSLAHRQRVTRARELRRERSAAARSVARLASERAESKKRQQAEAQVKQKQLLQLAIKRAAAQQKQVSAPPTLPPPSPPLPPQSWAGDPWWSSAAPPPLAAPPPYIPPPLFTPPVSTWSSAVLPRPWSSTPAEPPPAAPVTPPSLASTPGGGTGRLALLKAKLMQQNGGNSPTEAPPPPSETTWSSAVPPIPRPVTLTPNTVDPSAPPRDPPTALGRMARLGVPLRRREDELTGSPTTASTRSGPRNALDSGGSSPARSRRRVLNEGEGSGGEDK